MKTCKWCGNTNKDENSYCWYDGKPLDFDERPVATRSDDAENEE
jgi:hypothetical protein